MERNTTSEVAIVISLLAIVGVIGIGAYIYFTQPDEITFDLSDVEDTVDSKVKLIEINLKDLQYDFEDIEIIDMDDYLEVNDFWDELEKLEDDIDENKDDIRDNSRDIDDIMDCAEDYPNNSTKFIDCLNS